MTVTLHYFHIQLVTMKPCITACSLAQSVGDSVISPGAPWTGLAPPLMTRADDMYTAAADKEEDIGHFLPPPPTASLLEMCGSTISATQPVPLHCNKR